MCVSAYLQATVALGIAATGVADSTMEEARHFALRSLDRILAEAMETRTRVAARHRTALRSARCEVRGLLDDYAFTVLACLDAYEACADLSYFTFARRIADAMIERFYDNTGGGFFDTEQSRTASVAIGALAAQRKPFQDSPTPAGDSVAALALLRLHAYTNHQDYRDKAEETLEVFAGVAEQFGIYAGTYAIASVWMARPHTQVVVVGNDSEADALYAAAVAPFALNKLVLRAKDSEAVAPYLPPALQESVPNVPGVKEGKSLAIVCSNFTCQPPIVDPEGLTVALRKAIEAR